MTDPINKTVYEYSDLNDEEILAQATHNAEQAKLNADKEAKRHAKARSFRFVGGM